MTTWTLSVLLVVGVPADRAATAWQSDYAAAYERVGVEDKPLFVVFSPSWSHYTDMARQGTFVSSNVERLLQSDYVRMWVDTSSASGKALARQFNASDLQFVILDRTAKWQVFYHAGFIPERDLLRALTQFRRSKLGSDGQPVIDSEPTEPPVRRDVTERAQPSTTVVLAESRLSWRLDALDSDFDREVVARSHQHPVIVDFWAEWCGPCRMLAPTLERVASERTGQVVLAKVNIDRAPGVASRYRVEAIPTLLIFRDGKPVYESVGLISESQLRQILDRVAPREQLASQPSESDSTRR